MARYEFVVPGISSSPQAQERPQETQQLHMDQTHHPGSAVQQQPTKQRPRKRYDSDKRAMQRYRQRNREQLTDYDRQWRAEHYEEYREQQREYLRRWRAERKRTILFDGERSKLYSPAWRRTDSQRVNID